MKANAIAIALIITVGCGADSAQQSKESNSNLQIYTASASDGIVGTYKTKEDSINFEVLRITREDSVPSEDGSNYSKRDYDIVVRLSDAQNHTLSVLSEGHEIPSSWLDSPTDDITPNEDIIELADEAARVIESRKFNSAIKYDLELLTNQLRSLNSGALMDPADVDRLSLKTQMKALQKQQKSYSASMIYHIQGIASYWKPAFINGANAHHTATMTYRFTYNQGSWNLIQQFMRCNHGSCPTDSSMNYYTQDWGPLTAYYPVTPQMCSGWYGAPHVCNNDTKLQQDNVRYNQTYNTYGGVCSTTMYYRPY